MASGILSRYLRKISWTVTDSLIIAGWLVPAKFIAVMRKYNLSPVTKSLSKTDVRSVGLGRAGIHSVAADIKKQTAKYF